MVSILIANDETGKPAVCVVLGPENRFRTAEGDVIPGVALTPESARLVARNLLRLADTLEAGGPVN